MNYSRSTRLGLADPLGGKVLYQSNLFFGRLSELLNVSNPGCKFNISSVID